MPIRLHPQNGHYFLFRDAPVVLMGSSEHYGALINLDFDYIPYLEETRSKGLNLIRIFSGTYRETAGAFNIQDNTLAPSVARSIAPWKRTSTAGAADGGNKFDLTQWDAAYFSRLRDLVSQAGQRGIVVELTFFSAIYDDSLWNLSPMNGANHINGVGSSGRLNCYSSTGNLVPFQKALARKCATELNGYDNVIYEICNEPYNGGVTQAWESQIVNELAATEAALPSRHLIAQNYYNYQGVVSNPHASVSIFNFHYAYPNAASDNYGHNRALGDDETGFAGQTDFPYRREAWEFMLSGGGLFNHLDFSYTATRENGTAVQSAPGGGGAAIRRQLGTLRGVLEGLPLVSLVPQPGFVAGGVPSGGAARAIGAPGAGYALYLRGGSQANLVVNLPAGTYSGQWIDTKTGAVSATVASFTHAGGQRTLASPGYSEDIALRMSAGPPPVTGPQLLVNGSFESDYTGWTHTGSQLIQAGGTDGAKRVGFNGANQAPNGVLSQSFGTVAGQTYTLAFDAGVLSYGSEQQRVQITATGTSAVLTQVVSMTGPGNGVTRWTPQIFTFVANSATTTLAFRDQSTATNAIDLLLDNVRVTGPAGTGTPNTAPVAVTDTYSTQMNTALVVPAGGVLANDTDAQSHPLTAVLKTGTVNGSVSLNANGGFTYTPNTGYTGTDSFTYHAHDGLLNSNVVSMNMTVHAVVAGALVNGSFESGFTGWTATGNQAIFSAAPYAATNGSNLVGFNNNQLAPNAVLSQPFATTAGQTYTLAFDAGVLSYLTKSQTMLVTVTGASSLLSQTITLNGSGSGNRWVAQSFTFVANSATSTLTFRDQSSSTHNLDMLLDNVRVTGGASAPNTAPVAAGDTYSTIRDTALVIPATGVLGNDTDGQSNPLAAVLNSGPGHGSVTLNANGGFSYTPAAGYTGADSFTYHANDGSLDSNIATVNLTVNAAGSGGLVNGSFESDTTGWTATGNQAIHAAAPYKATHGSKLAGFNGGELAPNAVLSQTFATTAGQTYTLAFDAGALSFNNASQTMGVTVTGSGTLLTRTITVIGAGHGTHRWLPQSFTFVANSASATLTFRDQSTATHSIDLLLDNVRVTGAPALPPEAILPPVPNLGTATLAGTPGHSKIRMIATESGSYFLERSEDLLAWERVGEMTVEEPGPIEFEDPASQIPPREKMFYRVGLALER